LLHASLFKVTYNPNFTTYMYMYLYTPATKYIYGVILRTVRAGCHPVAIAQVVEH